jgi:hypothetical protein
MLDSSAVGVLRALGEQSVETKYNCDEWLKHWGLERDLPTPTMCILGTYCTSTWVPPATIFVMPRLQFWQQMSCNAFTYNSISSGEKATIRLVTKQKTKPTFWDELNTYDLSEETLVMPTLVIVEEHYNYMPWLETNSFFAK